MVPFPFSLVTESFSALENFRNVFFQLLSHLFEYVLCINYENFLQTRSNHYRISLTCDLNGHTRRSSPFLLRIISYKPEPVLSRMRVINVPDLQCAVVFFVTDVNEFISADGFIVAVINIRWLITIARIFTPKHFCHCITTGICISTGERDCWSFDNTCRWWVYDTPVLIQAPCKTNNTSLSQVTTVNCIQEKHQRCSLRFWRKVVDIIEARCKLNTCGTRRSLCGTMLDMLSTLRGTLKLWYNVCLTE